MPERVMFVQLKTGHNTDLGPCWISRVKFSKTWQTAYWHGKTLRRWTGMFDANFFDVETNEEYWLSGPHRDRQDTRFSNVQPQVDDDAREAYESSLGGGRASVGCVLRASLGMLVPCLPIQKTPLGHSSTT